MTWLAYTIITLGSSTLWGIVSGWLLYFYLPPGYHPLVPLAFYSIVILVSKAVNIFLGLPIGHLSDRTDSSWGRRLPYIIGGAFCLPIFFLLLWMPPDTAASNSNLIYLAVVLVGFNLAYEIHQIPYESLLPELAAGEKERVRISGWKTGFLLGGNILAGFAGPLIGSLGYTSTMWIFALGVTPILILPGFFLRKRMDVSTRPVRQISFASGLKVTFGNRGFMSFIVSWGLMWTATTLILETLPFIVTEVCKLSEADTVYFYIPAIGVTLLAFPFITRLSARYGANKVFSGSLLASALTLPILMAIGKSIPLALKTQGIVWMVLQSASLAGAQILPSAMLAEIADADERLTGQRREGSYYSVWGLANQVSSGVATAAIPIFLLLGRGQFEPQGPLGVRLLGLAGGLLLFASFWIFSRSGLKKNEPENG